MALTLTYRPMVKPWMTKQSEASLSFAPMSALYTVIGAVVSLCENNLFNQTPNTSLTSWQLFCSVGELMILTGTLVTHASVAFYLRNGFVAKNWLFHLLILIAPLGLLMVIVANSYSSLFYGLSSTFFVLFVMWYDLPFSQ